MNHSSSPQRVSGAEIEAILVALGIPADVITAFHDFVFAHPVPSLLIGITYVVMGNSVFMLWQRLINPWIERGVFWIDTRVQWLISQAHCMYCQHPFYQHRNFDVKGPSIHGIYTLQIEWIFVELSIVPKLLHLASPNHLPVSQVPKWSSYMIRAINGDCIDMAILDTAPTIGTPITGYLPVCLQRSGDCCPF